MSELTILHLRVGIRASQEGILSSSRLCMRVRCVCGWGCGEVTALIE